MLYVTISPSAIVSQGIPHLDCDLAHLTFVTKQLCNPQQSFP